MAFDVNFYAFTKRENSTAQPQSAARVFPCVIRDESGIINPNIEIAFPITENPSQYNYAYIQDFNRYYWVDEWTFAERLWSARLVVDPLATYKTQIGAADLYILRASAEYDGRVVDHLYPTKVDSSFVSNAITNPWELPTSGCYVLGIVDKVPKYGSISYYVLQPAAFKMLVAGLLDDTVKPENGFDQDFINEVGSGLVLSLVDPLQYIKSAMFFPVAFASIDKVPLVGGKITVFNYEIEVTGGAGAVTGNIATGGVPQVIINRTFNIAKHPQTAARGNYVNTSPYTMAQLIYPPFGTIELDTTVLCNASSFDVEIRVDLITGIGILEVKANGITLNKIETQIGVPMQLAQVTRDYLGSFNNIMSAGASVGNAISAGMSGNVGGIVSGAFGAAGAIGNAAASLVPRAQSIGSGGSFAQLYEPPRAEFQFFEIVDDDINHNGRPLCKIRKPSAIPGYMLIQDGDVPTPGTAEENRRIRSYLEGGFYFE